MVIMEIQNKVSLLDVFPRALGCPTQNFVAYTPEQRDDYVKRHIKVSDIYMSVYAFSEFDEYNDPLRDSAILDKVFFDFDSAKWFEDMKKLHAWCKIYDILHYKQYSGNGSHFFIFIDMDIEHKKEALGNFQRWIQKQLTLKIDKKIIGDIGRIFRYPNSYNYKGRRYCIPIPDIILEDATITEDWFYKNATKQELSFNGWSGHKLLSLKRWDIQDLLYCDQGDVNVNLKLIKPDIQTEYPEFPPCVQSWLSTPDLSGEGKFYLILFLKDQLFTKVPFDELEIISILKKSLEANEFDHYFGSKSQRGHEGHQGKKFKAIMRKDYYMPGCDEIQKKGYCPADCGRRNPIYN